jgi:signal transduction histidine kinase/DNA-binding response OmpR family regulator
MLGVSVFVGLMTMVGVLLHVHSIVLFGLMLLGLYVPQMILMLLFTFRRDWLGHLVHHLQLVVTFYIIVKLGGLHNSGGIILAGLSMVITSISFNSTKWAIWYFTFYLLCMLTVAGIQFKLQLPAEMSPQINHLFFLINTISLTAYTLVIVLVYLKQYTQTEKDKADKLKELDEVKTRLYTNITHEFRTPLTVILGMADQIEAQPDKWLKKGLGKIRQNGQILLHLVNQMLELAKLEARAMPMKMIHNDVIKYLKYLTESFLSMAESHRVQLFFQSDADSFDMDYDPDKLKGIVSNLLSNAIKYNRPEGTVAMHVLVTSDDHQTLEIRIRDRGIGIPADRMDHIFDRFYRIEAGSHWQVGGSGLGLAITRELVKLLNGEIEVRSEMSKGTEFMIKLPVSHNASPTELLEELVETGGIPQPEPDVPATGRRPVIDNKLPVLLIVEDNLDVTDYLFSLLENEYFIETAENGQTGLEKAVSLIPDIILSDVMMPEMDGIAMLDRLKKDVRTSHIPVIMLTAKADMDSRLEGLETGAEAYLEKPFNKEELFIRLRKLVELRRKLMERYSSFVLPQTSDDQQFRLEDGFMKKIHASFQENLGDEDFGIEQLCDIMAMSRAQLYRKFKALTNRTIIDYLNSFRLHRARQLLQESDMNVTQVAYHVGFKNLSHFSHRFSEEHGINPAAVKQNRS